ncbi:hypothetical protein ISCGN_026744 [Ixodes scapularis]
MWLYLLRHLIEIFQNHDTEESYSWCALCHYRPEPTSPRWRSMPWHRNAVQCRLLSPEECTHPFRRKTLNKLIFDVCSLAFLGLRFPDVNPLEGHLWPLTRLGDPQAASLNFI